MYKQVTDRYKLERVTTATPAELVGMLFDGAVKAATVAVGALEAGDAELARTQLMKAQDIVLELRCSLNHDAGGELARDLDSLYMFVHTTLVTANIRQDAASARVAIEVLTPLRDGWAESCLKAEPAGV